MKRRHDAIRFVPPEHGRRRQLDNRSAAEPVLPRGLSRPDALREFGLLIAVSVGLHPHDLAERKRCALPIPAAQTGWGLVDTGTSHTLIDARTITALRLAPMAQTAMTASTQREWSARPFFRARIKWPGRPSFPSCPVEKVMAGELFDNQGLIALIGRDVLQHFVLVSDGIAGKFALFPRETLRLQPAPRRPRPRRLDDPRKRAKVFTAKRD